MLSVMAALSNIDGAVYQARSSSLAAREPVRELVADPAANRSATRFKLSRNVEIARQVGNQVCDQGTRDNFLAGKGQIPLRYPARELVRELVSDQLRPAAKRSATMFELSRHVEIARTCRKPGLRPARVADQLAS